MVSLDYFYGRSLEKVLEGDEDWAWGIQLSGNCIIKNTDKRRTDVPEVREGDGFQVAIFGDKETRLQFGQFNTNTNELQIDAEVVFTPTQYSVVDPIYAPSEIFPQRDADQQEDVYELEEMEARTAEGPEEAVNGEEKLTDESTDSEEDTGADEESED